MLVYELKKGECYNTLVNLILDYGRAVVTVEEMPDGKVYLVATMDS